MKRRFWTVVLSLVAVLCLTFALTACGGGKTECEKGNHEFETAWTPDATYHWHKCKNCDEIADKAAHTPDRAAATETEPVKCSVCDYIITPATGHIQHTAGTKWLNDANEHWHKCTGCEEKLDKAAHTPDRAAATETEPVKCSVCDYIITPALGHTTHTAGTKWLNDANEHWHKCTGCEEKLDKAAHVYDKEVVADEYRASEATYTEPAKYYKSCVCGAKGTETFNNGSTLSAQDNQIKLKSGVTLGKTYDGAAYSLSADKFTVNGNGAITFEYKSVDASDWSASAPVNAGDYKVRVSVAATAEWKAAQATFDFAIAKKQLTISGTTVADKVYDGTAEATVTAGTLAGLINGDEVSVGVTAIGAFASKDVAYDIDVDPQDVTVSYTLTGDLAKNYLAPVGETLQAKINPKTLSNVNLTKVYDGHGSFERTALTVEQGLIAGESIKIYVDAIGANAGVYKDGNEDGDFDLNEYVLYIGDSEEQTVNYAWGDTCTATITAKQLTVTVSTVMKNYDGTTDFSQSVKAANVEGIVGSDDITVNMTGTLGNKSVTNAMQSCNVTFSLSGANKDNYTLKNATQVISVLVSKYNFNLDSKTGYASGKIYVTAKQVNNSGTITFENIVVTGDIFEGDTITATIAKNGDSSKMGCTEYKTNETNISETHYTITFGGADVGNYDFGGGTRYNPTVYLTIYEQEVTLDTEFTYSKIYSGMQQWIKVDLQKQEGEGYAIVAKDGTTIDTAKTKMYDMAGNEVVDMKPTADGTYFICVTATSDSAIGMTITSPAV